jgi:hypothetical protein
MWAEKNPGETPYRRGRKDNPKDEVLTKPHLQQEISVKIERKEDTCDAKRPFEVSKDTRVKTVVSKTMDDPASTTIELSCTGVTRLKQSPREIHERRDQRFRDPHAVDWPVSHLQINVEVIVPIPSARGTISPESLKITHTSARSWVQQIFVEPLQRIQQLEIHFSLSLRDLKTKVLELPIDSRDLVVVDLTHRFIPETKLWLVHGLRECTLMAMQQLLIPSIHSGLDFGPTSLSGIILVSGPCNQMKDEKHFCRAVTNQIVSSHFDPP